MNKGLKWGVLSLLGISVFLAGCGSDNSTPQGRVRVINAATSSSDTTFTLTVTNPGGTPGPSTATSPSLAYRTMGSEQLVTVSGGTSTMVLRAVSGGTTVTTTPTPTEIAGGNTYAVVL